MTRVLVLGGYGFIGAEIARALAADGFSVIGLGRNAALGRRLVPDIDWIEADISQLSTAGKWAPHLGGVGAIVNAAGALQEGPRDRLTAVHHLAVAACVEAAERAGTRRFIQISAVGAQLSASTAFLSSKGAGDAAVKASSLDWIIFRPGLVIGRNAYGGTALLRMLAGFPLMTPLVAAGSRIQTVALDDVAAAVASAVHGRIPVRRVYDLVEDQPHTLREIVRGFRRKLGIAPARWEIDLPRWTGAIVSLAADIAAWFGWRSSMRSTAIKVLAEDVLGDPAPWREATGAALKSFEETLTMISPTAQERLYARAKLAFPIMIVTLAMFWIASGVIGLIAIDAAARHLSAFGDGAARPLVVAASIVDIVIGAGMLLRSTSKASAIGSVVVAAAYLITATLAEPSLWLDPYGALLKIFPVMALGLAVALLMRER